MLEATFDFSEIEDYLDTLKELPEAAIQAATDTLEWAGETATQLAGPTLRGWHHPVDFGHFISRRGGEQIMYWGVDDQIWSWLDEGTGRYGPRGRPYPIRAKNAPALLFQLDYVPHTVPGRLPGNIVGGFARGVWCAKKLVMHPGIRPRGWAPLIMIELITLLPDVFFDNLETRIGQALKERRH